MPRKSKKSSAPTAEALARVINEALRFVQHVHGRFKVPEDALADEPERDSMVKYLQARAWRGTEAGACYSAGVSMLDLERWRQNPEFVKLENLADEACTDLLEESSVIHGYMGDKDMLKMTLQARRAKYSPRQEITGKGGGPVEFTITTGNIPRPKRLKKSGTED